MCNTVCFPVDLFSNPVWIAGTPSWKSAFMERKALLSKYGNDLTEDEIRKSLSTRMGPRRWQMFVEWSERLETHLESQSDAIQVSAGALRQRQCRERKKSTSPDQLSDTQGQTHLEKFFGDMGVSLTHAVTNCDIRHDFSVTNDVTDRDECHTTPVTTDVTSSESDQIRSDIYIKSESDQIKSDAQGRFVTAASQSLPDNIEATPLYQHLLTTGATPAEARSVIARMIAASPEGFDPNSKNQSKYKPQYAKMVLKSIREQQQTAITMLTMQDAHSTNKPDLLPLRIKTTPPTPIVAKGDQPPMHDLRAAMKASGG